VRRALRGEIFVPLAERLEVLGSRPHGHVQALRVAMQRLGIESLIGSRPSAERDRILALIAARVLAPHTKLATTRWWHTSTLAEEFGVSGSDEDDLYAAMDWLLERQPLIERKLAARHLGEGSLALYDLSSSYFVGTHCPLGKIGYSRSRARWHLRHPHRLTEEADVGARRGAQLQGARASRARVPIIKNRGLEDPPDPPPAREPSGGAHLPLHARLLRRMASDRSVAAAAVRR
jgi:hypothetical protein